MEQKMKFELTDRDAYFLSKFRELIKDSDGVSYFGWMDALTSLVYRTQKLVCYPSLKSEEGYEDICKKIDDVETNIVEICRIITDGVKEELAQLLDEDAKKEPNTNIKKNQL